jgi:hypothetical protein
LTLGFSSAGSAASSALPGADVLAGAAFFAVAFFLLAMRASGPFRIILSKGSGRSNRQPIFSGVSAYGALESIGVVCSDENAGTGTPKITRFLWYAAEAEEAMKKMFKIDITALEAAREG